MMRKLLLSVCALWITLSAFAQGFEGGGGVASVQINGPFSTVFGTTASYTVSYRDGNGNPVTPPPGSAAWSVSGGALGSNDASGCQVYWNAIGSGSISFTYSTFDGSYFDTRTVTVAVPPANTPSTSFTQQGACNSTIVTRTTNPPDGITWFWQTSSTGTSTTLGSGSSITITSNTTLFLRARQNFSPFAWSSSSQSVGSIVVNFVQAPATGLHGDVITNSTGTVFLNVSAVSGATSYRWYDVPTGGAPISGVTGTSYSTSISQNKSFYVETMVGTCASLQRREVQGRKHPTPVISSTNAQIISQGNSVQLNLNYAYDVYEWRRNGVVIPGAIAPTLTASLGGDYTVRVNKGNSTAAISPVIKIEQGAYDQNRNFIITNFITVPNIRNVDDIQLLPITSVSQTVQYFDKLGRPEQVVTTQGSPLLRDLVQPVAYDSFGREAMSYLPYVPAESHGRFKSAALANPTYTSSGQYVFYNGTTSAVSTDVSPFGVTVFERSPLNRVIKQGSPGQAWQPNGQNDFNSTDRTVKFSYEFNTDNEVLNWTISGLSSPDVFGLPNAGVAGSLRYYGKNELTRTRTKDEQGNQVIEYKDKTGKVILKRVQATASNSPVNDTNYASTYYVYDDQDNLVCVIPPEAVTRLSAQYFPSSIIRDSLESYAKRWFFRYRYDQRKRMIGKQVPGAGAVWMVYDRFDRVVLTQDANQRQSTAGDYWTFTKYDEYNRPIATGIKQVANDMSRAQLQIEVDNFYSSGNNRTGERFIGTAAANNIHGYTNTTYPITTRGSVADAMNYLTITYYDDYRFKNEWGIPFDFISDPLTETVFGVPHHFPLKAFDRVIGQVTGTKVKVLNGGYVGGATYLKTVNYYDDQYRVIQTIADNYRGGRDRISSLYDFTGKVLRTRTTHKVGALTLKDLVSVRTSGDTIASSSTQTGWYTSAAASVEQLPAGKDGWFEFTSTGGLNSDRMIGLAPSNIDAGYDEIHYAIFLTRADNELLVYQHGIMQRRNIRYKVGQVVRLERKAGIVRAYLADSLIHEFTSMPSSTSLLADMAFFQPGSSIARLRASFSPDSTTINRRFVYDHAGRLLETWHRIGAGAEILLAKSEYNELGQLIDKKLHSTVSGGTNARQSVDYRYNIRGWLTSINNPTLTNDGGVSNNDTGDLFGMNLYYNQVNASLANQAAFNGNISAIQWSNNAGLGNHKQKAYSFTYDPMNRIASTTFRRDSAGWVNPTNNRFTETGYSYDLNGNILTMTRNDGRSSGTMDILSYNYGNFGNQLQAVTDAGDKNKGFVDLNTSLQDYRYDANGNMINDLNKGIGDNINDNTNRIQYNFLNLPELITKRNASLRYIYDATGRKLAQVANYGSSSVTTDYVGEFVYEDNRLQFINHEEGRIVMSAVQTTAMYNGENTNNVTASNVTLSNVTQNGTEKYLRAASTGTTVRSGVNRIGGAQAVVGGEVYKIRLKGYTTGTNPAFLNIRTNNTDLDWMNVRLPNNEKTEIWVERTITIPAGHTSMEVNVQWNTVNATDVMFINELEIIKQQTKSPEYQYYYKDHLGNIRLVFTTIQEQEIANAGYETANLSAETSRFQRMENARRVNSSIFDRTNGANSGFSQRLTGGTNEKYGIARTIKVMPGDTVKMEVYAKYVDRNTANWTSGFQTLMNSIAAASPTGGVVVDGSSYSTSTSSFPFPSQHNFADRTTGTAPRAFLNYISFDDNWNPILLDNTQTNFVRLSSTPIERGQDVAHERMAATFVVKQPGYVYIYLSNDETTPLEVFFDDFNVTHAKGPVVQSQDYYPFGLTFNSYKRESSTENRYLYNQGTGEKTFNTERIIDLELNVDQSKYRTYDYTTGRWWQVDPKADMFFSMTPYNYSFNDPVRYNDPEGDCPTCPGAFVDLMIAAKLYWNRLSGATQRLASGTSGSLPSNAPVPNDVRQMQKMMGTMNDAKTVAQAVVDGPGRVASFTDANDITVLAAGQNLDGTKASTGDYVFAGVGLFLPVSGSAIKKLAGGGLDVLEGITKKIGNISSHLTDKDVTGAVRDVLGDPVIINGKQYDHLGEVNDALTGLGNQLEKLNKAISSGDLTGDVLKEAQRIRSSVQKEKDRIQNLLNKAQQAANE